MSYDTDDAVLDELKQALTQQLSPGWHSVEANWAQVGESPYPLGMTVIGGESQGDSNLPEGINSLFEDLRGRIAEREELWPISLTVIISDRIPQAGIHANFHERIIVPADDSSELRPISGDELRPSAEDWRRELELHPRADEQIPDWWRKIVETGSTDYEPELPTWMGRPMPQSIDDAEAMPRDLLGPMDWLKRTAGYRDLIDPLRAPIFNVVREASPGELDAIFGKRGISAQNDAQRRLAETATQQITNLIDSIPENDASEMVFVWQGRMRMPHTNSTGEKLRDEARQAAKFLAFQMVRARFGGLPPNWHEK